MTFRRLFLASSLSIAALVSAGCSRGPKLGQVTGQVSQDGTPIPFALVRFQPTQPRGTYASAYTDVDGNYTLLFSPNRKGALIGRHEVTIRTSRRDEIQVEDKSTGLMVSPPLPPSYKGNLELKFEREVASGSNLIDFELEVTPGPAVSSAK